MSEASASVLTGTRAGLVSALAGGAGLYFAGRLSATVWVGVSAALTSQPLWLPAVFPAALTTVFAVLIGLLLGHRPYILAALAGAWVFSLGINLLPIALSALTGLGPSEAMLGARLTASATTAIGLIAPSLGLLATLFFVRGDRA